MAENEKSILINTKNKNEAEEIMAFVQTLSKQERQGFLVFLEGIKVARSLPIANSENNDL